MDKNTENRGRKRIIAAASTGAVLLGLATAAFLSDTTTSMAVNTVSNASTSTKVTVEKAVAPTPTPTVTTKSTKVTARVDIRCKNAKGTIYLFKNVAAPGKCPAGFTLYKVNKVPTAGATKTKQTVTNTSTKVTATPKTTITPSGSAKCPSYDGGDKSSADWVKCWAGMTPAPNVVPLKAISCTAIDSTGQNWRIVIKMGFAAGGNFGKTDMGSTGNDETYVAYARGWTPDRVQFGPTGSMPVLYYAWGGLSGSFYRQYDWYGDITVSGCK